jgi:drug/metabolite transporter (DMT)-like permease
MWLFFAILTGAFNTGQSLIERFVLRQQKDYWAFAFFFSLVGSIISFPFMLASPKVPTQLSLWLLAMLVGLLIVANNLLLFRSSGLLQASLVGALLKLRLVWVFILGLFILHEPFSPLKLAGTILAIAAGVIIIHNFRKPKSATGVSLVLVATLFNAALVILSKYLLSSFNVASLTFFASFLPPLVIIFILMPNRLARIRKMFKEDWPMVLLACAFGAFANLTLNAALSLHDAASVLVVNEVFLVLVLAGEHTILKEREQAWIKIVSITLAILGAILIEVSH